MIQGLVLLLGLVSVLPVVSFVLSLFHHRRQNRLTRRHDELQRRLDGLASDLREMKARLETEEHRAQAAATVSDESVNAPVPPSSRPARERPIATAARARRAPIRSASRSSSLERLFGTRAAVMLGAVALALAGAFLVKYSFEQGWVGPTARVTLGLAFGVSLLGCAEWLRMRSAYVAQGLAAAGVAVLYAALLAGTNLYGIFPDLAGGLGMAVTTAVAVFLSTRHGQLVAILGLLGGFLTPIWIGTETPQPWLLLFYLLAVQAGLFVVSRRMRWGFVAGLTLLSAMGWSVLWLADINRIGGGSLVAGLFLLGSIGSVVVTALSASDDSFGDRRLPTLFVMAGSGVGVVLMAALGAVGEFGWTEWIFFGILGAGCLWLGRREARYEALPWVSTLVGAGMLFLWGIDLAAADQTRFWWTAATTAALYVGGAYLCMYGRSRLDRWALLSGVSGVVYLLVAYFALDDAGFSWGLQTMLLAGVFVGLAYPLFKVRSRIKRAEAALGALLVTAAALVTIAVPMELERGWIGVLWALQVPALLWLAGRFRLPVLDKVAFLVGALVAVRLLLNPVVLAYPIGDAVLLNWTLYGYGIPIVTFALAAALLRRRATGAVFAGGLEVAAAALGFAFITLNIHQFFEPGNPDRLNFTLQECGTYTVFWILYALVLLALGRRTGRRLHLWIAAVCGSLALAQGMTLQGLFANPLFHDFQVGQTALFNSLLFVYGLPALLAAWLAAELRRNGLAVPSRVAGAGALVFAFLTLSLEVRQAFHGTVLTGGDASNAEMYTYSLVWVLFATALLVAGIATKGPVLRYGSAVVMLLAVGKVFLVDTAHLQDLYRVFSLFGLGVSLMLLAYLYQRFVFATPRTASHGG